MTNTTYFHSVFRDDESSSSFSSDQVSQQLDSEKQQASSFLYSVISKAGCGWIISRRPEGSNYDEKDHLAHGNISSESALPSCEEGGKIECFVSKRFKFQELEAATNYFHRDNELGEGCFGKVYKGWIDEKTATSTKPGEGIPIAVKRHECQGKVGNREWDVLDIPPDEWDVLDNHGWHTEWAREVEYLGRLCHPNLVRLCGHCSEEQLLAYEFMSQGSLDNHLFKRGSSGLLSWSIRMKIALGAAKGLAFLHSAEINVIHRGFKSSDILLDSGYNAKISDFGLAMDGSTGDISTGVFGTPGYTAPEYIATGRLSTKSDVYSFGVVLLEILSGRRVIEYSTQSSQYNLAYWANPSLSHEEKVIRVLDRRLKGQYPVESAHTAVMLALLCVVREAKSRPKMDEVVTVLEGLQDQQNLTDQE